MDETDLEALVQAGELLCVFVFPFFTLSNPRSNETPQIFVQGISLHRPLCAGSGQELIHLRLRIGLFDFHALVVGV